MAKRSREDSQHRPGHGSFRPGDQYRSQGRAPDMRDHRPRPSDQYRGSDQHRGSRPSERGPPPEKKTRLFPKMVGKVVDKNSSKSQQDGDALNALLIQLAVEISNNPHHQKMTAEIFGSRFVDDLAQANNPQTQKRARELLHPVPEHLKGAETMPVLRVWPRDLETALTSEVHLANPFSVPPLPEIKDPKIARLPFIHRSTYLNDSRDPSTMQQNYERLEVLGDAYIEVMATNMLYRLYPRHPAGRICQMREQLVCNETLASYSLAYSFAERAEVPAVYMEEGASRVKIWTKVLGDIFEAYVAAVIEADPEHGYGVCEDWLCRLWMPRLFKGETAHEPDKNAKQELARRIGGVGVKILYEKQGEPEQFKGGQFFTIACLLTGWGWERELLATYKGRSKQVAELGAAEVAMENVLLAQVQAIKKKYDEEVRKERAEKEAAAKQEGVDEIDKADLKQEQRGDMQ